MVARKILGRSFAVSTLALLMATPVIGQVINNFDEAITQTVLENPEVKATWYDFEATRQQERVAFGNYLPQLDLNGEIGREESSTPLIDRGSYERDASNLTLTQMIFDGFETHHEVERLGYAKLAKYYEIEQASERTALETAQSYLDVLRYQGLVNLAKQNYINHKKIYDDISQRAEAGISRRVDLEQASGRLALAESNLLTEVTNLHDVSVRFQRLTGSLPAEQLAPVLISTGLLADNKELILERAYVTSPVVNSAIENLRSAQSEVEVAKAAYYPKFDIRARKQIDHNTDGIDGRYDEEAIELVMTYNLYNGGSDIARKRQLYHQMNSARELRQKACRDVRQQVSIAYNDIISLEEQIEYLRRNKEAISSARVAYRKQFDIGQRTLLDLLDTENEFFEVQRAYKNATQDLLLAQVRTLSGMGVFLDSLGLAGREAEALEYVDTEREEDADIGGRCPKGVARAMMIDKDALFATLLSEANAEAADDRMVFEAVESDGEVKMDVKINFAYKSASVDDSHTTSLQAAAALLGKYPTADAEIAGYTDSVAPQSYNLGLSQRRADAVRQALIDDYGIESYRLTAVGYGEDNPIADNDTPEGQARNRRVELVLDIEQEDDSQVMDFAPVEEGELIEESLDTMAEDTMADDIETDEPKAVETQYVESIDDFAQPNEVEQTAEEAAAIEEEVETAIEEAAAAGTMVADDAQEAEAVLEEEVLEEEVLEEQAIETEELILEPEPISDSNFESVDEIMSDESSADSGELTFEYIDETAEEATDAAESAVEDDSELQFEYFEQ